MSVKQDQEPMEVLKEDILAPMLTNVLNLSAKRSKMPNDLMLPWDRFSHWVHSILVVTFDIEMGQSLETIYPCTSHVKLTPVDKTNICYLSFPDSNSGFLGDSQFHFRFRQDTSINSNHHLHSYYNLNSNNSTLNPNYDDYNRKTLTGLEVDKNYMFGYVFFRQVKDKNLKRGYFQKVEIFFYFFYIQ